MESNAIQSHDHNMVRWVQLEKVSQVTAPCEGGGRVESRKVSHVTVSGYWREEGRYHMQQSKAMQSNAKQCSAMQRKAMQCKAKQRNVKHIKALRSNGKALQHKAERCEEMQSNAKQCKAMQSEATRSDAK